MALHESKKIGESDILYYSPNSSSVLGINIPEDGLYQIVYGGFSSASGGSYINLYYNSHESSSDPVILDSVFCPQDSTNSDFGMKINKFYLHKDDFIDMTFHDATERFLAFELIG